MKSKKEGKFKVSASSNMKKSIALGVSAFLVLGTIVLINKNNNSTIDIVRAKQAIYVNQPLSANLLEAYPMAKYEFDNSANKYVKWEEVDTIVGQFTSTSTKAKGYIYKGDYKLTKPVKNEWLRDVKEGNVVVSLPYDRAKSFGNILTPGDKVKVNVTYMDNVDGYGSRPVSATMYESARVIDLLNASGNSIYDYYTDLLNMEVTEREKLLKDKDFLQNVAPTRIIYEVNKNEGFSKYAEYAGKQGIQYLYGLYPRKEGDIILEQFSDLTRQMTSSEVNAKTEADAAASNQK